MTQTGLRRQRVLIGAYACGPLAEPEARAGWEMARAAARDHDVVVITRPRFRPSITAALADDPELARHLEVHYLDLSARAVRLKRRSWDLYWYYPLWQRAAGRFARELHADRPFDLAHHVTFANDWMPSGLSALSEIPLVWGPVGGSSRLPVRKLAPWLGARGTATEIMRAGVTTLARRIGGDPTASRAALVIAQNKQVGAHFARIARSVVVEPNASLEHLPDRATEVEPRTAVFVGRLLAWKGAALAIDTIAHPRSAGWRLAIYGEGYDESRLRARVAKLGIEDRVEFLGHRPRAEVLAAMAKAEAFLFPSMHDQAGWVVAEASSIGVPVVCLPLGGPPLLAEPNAFVASLSGDIVANLAEELERAAATGATPTDRWSVGRLPDAVSGWYRLATANGSTALPEHASTPVGNHPKRTTRVLESFGIPKATTNPYITQLYTSLNDRSDVEVIPFSHKAALLAKYDVVHLHWPELLMGGHNWRGLTARRALTSFLLLRWRITRTPIVRTVHNLERPTNINAFDNLLLDEIDRLTTLDIRLNEQTPERAGIQSIVIPHGHYSNWYPEAARGEAVPGRIGYVGLIRRYKGVEDLVTAFAEWSAPGASLHIAGKPSSDELVELIMERAGGDERVTLDPRYLSEWELVETITASELIVLPYRHMHNSGTALAALSLARPVLVPENEVNRALAAEVGPGWVHTYSGELTSDDLARAWSDSRERSDTPDLSQREWPAGAEAHAGAFRLAPRRGN